MSSQSMARLPRPGTHRAHRREFSGSLEPPSPGLARAPDPLGRATPCASRPAQLLSLDRRRSRLSLNRQEDRMSASYFRTLIGYNRWAWGRILERAAELSEAEYSDPRFNFGSIRSTLLHASSTESNYYNRRRGLPTNPRRTEEDFPSLADLRKAWDAQFEDQKAWAAELTDA